MRNPLKDLATVVRGGLRLLARPVRSGSERSGLVVRPFRGYGTREEALLVGRVMRQPGALEGSQPGSLGRDLWDTARRVFRRGIADAEIRARFAGAEEHVTSERGGYFRVRLRAASPPDGEGEWHPVHLELLSPRDEPEEGTGTEAPPVRAEGQVFIPPPSARTVVISDIDDTVMHTGVADKAMMLYRLFAQQAESRTAFPGVGALYRGLHDGPTGDECNPMLYVSRGPWAIYDVLESFFELHEIPVGPILFLRDWGLHPKRPLPRRGKGHKLELIRDMLSLYEDRPFVLIGDSGQHDPETYARVVRENRGRVKAVYIRNVDPPDRERAEEIEALAKEVAEAGSSLLLAADSFAMAEHAFEHGLISKEVLSRVLAERDREKDEEEPPLQPTEEAAPEEEALEEKMEEGGTEEAPTNVVVEGGQRE